MRSGAKRNADAPGESLGDVLAPVDPAGEARALGGPSADCEPLTSHRETPQPLQNLDSLNNQIIQSSPSIERLVVDNDVSVYHYQSLHNNFNFSDLTKLELTLIHPTPYCYNKLST